MSRPKSGSGQIWNLPGPNRDSNSVRTKSRSFVLIFFRPNRDSNFVHTKPEIWLDKVGIPILSGPKQNLDIVQNHCLFIIQILSGPKWNPKSVREEHWTKLGFCFGPDRIGIPTLSNQISGFVWTKLESRFGPGRFQI